MKRRFVTLALAALALGVARTGATSTGTATGGVEIAISCGAVGQELNLCRNAANAWAQRTGNRVRVIGTPNSTTDRLALYQQNLSAGSTSIDVYQIDVIWPGILGQFFVDLKEFIPAAEVSRHFPRIVENNTVGGRLVGMPWFTDAGLLYYRTDLLQKYGFQNPPRTWSELFTQAQRIQQGERRTNRNFYGFVYQGNSYEGLTCDALEWIYSYNGGTIVDAQGNVTVNNPRAAQALSLFANQIKTVAPAGVTTYGEEEARNVFQAGNSAFMRNWPYAYSLGSAANSPIRGRFATAPLPRGGADGRNAGTLGGWQLAVSRFSRNPAVAADLVRYLTSPEVQKDRAIRGSYAPTISALYQDPAIPQAQPVFRTLGSVLQNAVARPSTATGSKYNQVSSAFWTAVNRTLRGQGTAQQNLAQLETQLNRIKGAGF